MFLLLLISLFSTRAVLSEDIIERESREDISNHYIETVKELADGEHVVIRSRRSALTDVCKYKKGEWSECDQMLMLLTRVDSLKTTHSSPGCDKTRTITKNCRDEETGNKTGKTTCVFEKPKNVPWTSCMDSGVRQRTLPLVAENGPGGCPKEKVMSKKCKGEKKNKNKKDKKKESKKEKHGDKKGKCQFTSWEAWTPCSNNIQQRIRKVLKGAERNSCKRKAIQNNKC
eukprot:TRINITY_DN21616_c0_g1_i4.p1 TRINITY_DN21616_c0_g1~~TRINITY_DN21616_c0_g1_i4.p1  ORF type:complete len:229 (+),score=68.45 TRINITY_DN21616_c0_g1_i4:35-721(+)